jgi:hypothetical protein
MASSNEIYEETIKLRSKKKKLNKLQLNKIHIRQKRQLNFYGIVWPDIVCHQHNGGFKFNDGIFCE